MEVSIKSLEAELSNFSKNTVDFNAFLEYIAAKLQFNQRVASFCQKMMFRKQKFNSYQAKLKLDQKHANVLHSKYPVHECVLVIGNWSQGNRHLINHAPVKGKGFRNFLVGIGYTIIITDEHNSSKKCSNCEFIDANLTFTRKYIDPRPWKQWTSPLCRRNKNS